jgi:hypothetical protein
MGYCRAAAAGQFGGPATEAAMTEAYYTQGGYDPRSGDGSIAAEDDALLRKPGDDADIERLDTDRGGHPSQPSGGPDDPAYTGED